MVCLKAELANLTSPILAEVIDQAHGHRAGSPHPSPGLLIPAPDRPVGLMTHQPDTQDPLVLEAHGG